MRTLDPAENAISGTPLTDTEREVLRACQEVTLRQREVLPHLARTLEVSVKEVFYAWALRRCPQSGQVAQGNWRYFFHGLECDLMHEPDGRFLRIDFGPGGRLDTFTSWGVLQFVMTTTAPWREFPRLKQYFAEHGPPYDQNSGSMTRLVPIWDRLDTRGAFAKADPALVEFQAKHTEVREGGMRFLRFPPDTPEKLRVDCSVAHRTIISPYGHGLLGTRTVTNGD
jgi:hypothetical protein